jgi:fibronectin-binding autotransporter adhesin
VVDLELSSVGGRFRAGVVLAASVFVLMLAVASAAQATTWVVTNTNDGASTCPSASSCTLRGAITSAANGDAISVPAGIYTLNGAKGAIEVAANISIAGAGASATTITASPASELIEVDSAELSLSGITFKGGAAGASGHEGRGGALTDDGGKVLISNSAFTDNTANGETTNASYDYGGDGGAIFNDSGELTVSDSSFTSNTAAGGANADDYAEGGYGGAIYSEDGELTVSSCSFASNIAAGSSKTTGESYEDGGVGGAIFSQDGHMSITGATFSANSAQGGATDPSTKDYADGGYGGAIYTDDGTTTIDASTLSANTTTGGGATDTALHGGESSYGGALDAEDGTTTVSASTFSANSTGAGQDGSGSSYGDSGGGGAIYASDGDFELVGDTVSGNVVHQDAAANSAGDGGGLYTEDGLTTITQSVFSSNLNPGGYGGGIYSEDERLSLSQSTIGPSDTADYGAGIYHEDGPAAITNATIADNTATDDGGGIYNEGVADLANVSLVGNTAQDADGGGNLYLDEYTMTLHDSLIAAGVSPTSGGNCAFDGGLIASEGYNAEDSNQCTLSGTGNVLNAVLNLGPLQGNGGPTPTIALGAGSQAIDAGDPSGCTDAEGNPLTVDQRGVLRPQGPRCDIGAFEVEVPTPAPTPIPTPISPATTKPKPPSVTSFATSLSVKLSSGAGTLTAGCGAPAEESCTFTLTLYATVKSAHASSTSKRVKVGTVSGKIQGGHVGKLTVKLNATGRSLLKHGSLHLEAKGTIKDTAGLVTQFHRSITIKKKQ